MQSFQLASPATSLELSRDRQCITVANGSSVSIIDSNRYFYLLQIKTLKCHFPHLYSFKQLKSFTVPSKAYSASLHPNKSCFVVGGEDFKLYKFSYDTGKELGTEFFSRGFTLDSLEPSLFIKPSASTHVWSCIQAPGVALYIP